MLRFFTLTFVILLLGFLSHAQTTYHVSVTDQDAAGQDGLSSATAWKSLAYACDQGPEGTATVQLGEGAFATTKTTMLKRDFTSTVYLVNSDRNNFPTSLLEMNNWQVRKPTTEPISTDEGKPTSTQPEISDTTVVTSINPTSSDREEEFMIYPNPASHSLTVRRAVSYSASFSAELINLLGVPLEILRSSAGNQVQLNVSAYAPGVYFVRLHASGEETIQRVIKR